MCSFRLGIILTFALACVLEAVGVTISVLAPNLAGLTVSSLLLGGTFMAITALGLAWARNRCSGDPRALLAMMTAAFGLGQIIGPIVADHLRDSTGSFMLPSLLASAALLIAAIVVRYEGMPIARTGPA